MLCPRWIRDVPLKLSAISPAHLPACQTIQCNCVRLAISVGSKSWNCLRSEQDDWRCMISATSWTCNCLIFFLRITPTSMYVSLSNHPYHNVYVNFCVQLGIVKKLYSWVNFRGVEWCTNIFSQKIKLLPTE